MKKEKAFNLIGLILGAAIILAGILIMANDSTYLSYTTRADSYTFGADYYTEQYAATRAAVNNTAVAAGNLCLLGERLAGIWGLPLSSPVLSSVFPMEKSMCSATRFLRRVSGRWKRNPRRRKTFLRS